MIRILTAIFYGVCFMIGFLGMNIWLTKKEMKKAYQQGMMDRIVELTKNHPESIEKEC